MYLSRPVLDALLVRLGYEKYLDKVRQGILRSAGSTDSDRGGSLTSDESDVSATAGRLTYPHGIKDVRVVRRSLDARKRRRNRGVANNNNPNDSADGPIYSHIIDVDITSQLVYDLRLKHKPGRNERLSTNTDDNTASSSSATNNNSTVNDDDGTTSNNPKKPKVVIVGAGPAGLFAALTLARSGLCTPVLLERGQPVEARGRDIGALIHRRNMNKESNYAFGEGGAGTWSDGKLTTRIGRNSASVRKVLETFVEYGAPEKILVDGSPHLGTDNLQVLLRNMRLDLRREGVEIRFGARVSEFHFDPITDRATGVTTVYSPVYERNTTGWRDDPELNRLRENSNTHDQDDNNSNNSERIDADAVILATGHSARDVYERLHEAGVKLEAKGFATGFRIEHPQKIINKIRYGDEWGARTYSGRLKTDEANRDYFISSSKGDGDVDGDVQGDGNGNDNDNNQKETQTKQQHKGKLPVPSYRLATDRASDGTSIDSTRDVYSFCMCPGGQVVLASTEPDEICVNGMSYSKRDSQFANSGLVVSIAPDDPVLEPYRQKHGILAGIHFQRDMERRAAKMGGGNFTVPVQRLTDFLEGIPSTTAPPSSYKIRVRPSACHEIYPPAIVHSIRDAVTNHFERMMPGYVCDDALLHGVETRTSSPVRVCRDVDTLEALGKGGLFPAGEGSGFAGGIVSAAVDGMVVADAVLEGFMVSDEEERKGKSRDKSVGFMY